MPTNLLIHNGTNSGSPREPHYNTSAIESSDTIYQIALTANTPQTTPVPLGSNFAVFSSTGDFFASFDGVTAAIPTSATWTTGNVELNAGVRKVSALTSESATVISVIAEADCKITIAFYA